MDQTCHRWNTCRECTNGHSCVWGILYQQPGRCVADVVDLGEDVIGIASLPEDCDQPSCSATIVRNVATTNWTVMGLGIMTGSIIIGALGIVLFWWLSRRYNRPPVNVDDVANVQGYIPAVGAFMRRVTVRRWLDDVLRRAGDAEDAALALEVFQQLAAGNAEANEANAAINQLQVQNAQAQPVNQPQQNIIEPAGNPLLNVANQFEPQDLAGPAAIANEQGQYVVLEMEELGAPADAAAAEGVADGGPPDLGRPHLHRRAKDAAIARLSAFFGH